MAMSGRSDIRVRAILFGLAVCLLLPACRTYQEKEADADAATSSSDAVRDVLRRLNAIIIPEMTFFPPATIIDAVDFLKQASRDYDTSGTPLEQRGISFLVHLPRAAVEPFAEAAPTNCAAPLLDPFAVGNSVAPLLGAIAVRDISLYDALRLVCDVTDMRWRIGRDGKVILAPKGWDLEEDWATRSYSIPLDLTEHLFHSFHGQATDADPNKIWQAFFDDLGVAGPEFARFEYLPAIGKLRVTNTPQNLAVIEAVFDRFALRMVEVEMQIHAFRAKDVERLRLAGGVSVGALMALRQQGKARPVATATVLTKSGQEAVVKAVREVIYPTELLTECGPAGSNVTSRSAAKALAPGSFEMRETGMILPVVPEVAQNGTLINLMLNPTWVTLEGWKSYPADLAAGWVHKTLAFKQPVFGTTSFQTQVAVEDGGTVLLGSCSTPDGEWVQVGFLTVRLRDVLPKTPGGKLDSAPRARRDGHTDKTKPQDKEWRSKVTQKMREIVISEMHFRPPATIIDAVRFFKEASVKYDASDIPAAQRGVSFVLELPAILPGQTESVTNADPFAEQGLPTHAGAPVISALSARFINLYDALKLVCDVTGMKFRIRDGIVWIVPEGEPEDDLTTRVYPVLPSLCDGVHVAGDSHVDDRNRQVQEWKAFFAQMGVNWPDGSSVNYVESTGLLRVTNTPENLEVFEQVLENLNVCPSMVEVDVQLCAFPTEDLEKLRLSGDVSVAALTALRQQGRAKPVASATVLTKSGQEAVMKSVREILYPTELGIDGGAGALTPCNFEMREVGMMLQVVPEIGSLERSQINVMLNPRWVTLDRWETYPADQAAGWAHKTLPFRQPVFGVTSFQTQASVKDGGTVLLGSSSTPDGKWVHVGFLTVRRVDAQAGESRNEQ